MLVRRVLLRNLLVRHELEPDDDQRRRQEEEGEPHCHAEELRLVRYRGREGVDEDEAERAERRESEQGEHGELCRRIWRQSWHDPRVLRLRSPPAPPDE